jgi:acylphosphatase
MEGERICRRCRVTGRVQGVSYRAFAQRLARQLGVMGHARNLPDGSVEVLACGAPEAVAGLCEWLRRGPPHAEVTALECSDVAGQEPDRFRIL